MKIELNDLLIWVEKNCDDCAEFVKELAEFCIMQGSINRDFDLAFFNTYADTRSPEVFRATILPKLNKETIEFFEEVFAKEEDEPEKSEQESKGIYKIGDKFRIVKRILDGEDEREFWKNHIFKLVIDRYDEKVKLLSVNTKSGYSYLWRNKTDNYTVRRQHGITQAEFDKISQDENETVFELITDED